LPGGITDPRVSVRVPSKPQAAEVQFSSQFPLPSMKGEHPTAQVESDLQSPIEPSMSDSSLSKKQDSTKHSGSCAGNSVLLDARAWRKCELDMQNRNTVGLTPTHTLAVMHPRPRASCRTHVTVATIIPAVLREAGTIAGAVSNLMDLAVLRALGLAWPFSCAWPPALSV